MNDKPISQNTEGLAIPSNLVRPIEVPAVDQPKQVVQTEADLGKEVIKAD